MALTARDKMFGDYIAAGKTQTEAAILAGYSKRSARNTGSRKMKNDELRQYIRARMRELAAPPEEILAFLTSVMRGQVKDQFDLDASLSDRIRAGESLMKSYEKLQADDKQTEVEDLTPLVELLKP